MALGIQGVLTGYCLDEVQLCCQQVTAAAGWQLGDHHIGAWPSAATNSGIWHPSC